MSIEGGEMLQETAAVKSAGTPIATTAPRGAGLLWMGFALLIIGVGGAAMWQKMSTARLGEPLPVYGAVPNFGFTDEKNTSVTLADLKGHPWVVDFIFTRCGGQCPMMTQRMMALQGWLRETGHDQVKLVSVTVDPETDDPAKLAEYGKTFHAEPQRWSFLTGERLHIYDLITTGFKLGVEENKGKPVSEMFVHSNKFALVDPAGQIRGYFTPEEDGEMKRLQAAIRRISKEMPAAGKS